MLKPRGFQNHKIMSKTMRDIRRKKQRDLRRAYFGGDRPRLYEMFDRMNGGSCLMYSPLSCEDYDRQWNDYRTWIRTTIKDYAHICNGNAPASFRRDLTRQARVKDKVALQRAVANWDFDDF